MLMVKPLQPLSRLEKHHLHRPHYHPHKHHGEDLAGEIQIARPKRLVPRAREELRRNEKESGDGDVVVVPCCVGRVAPLVLASLPQRMMPTARGNHGVCVWASAFCLASNPPFGPNKSRPSSLSSPIALPRTRLTGQTKKPRAIDGCDARNKCVNVMKLRPTG